MFRLLLTLLLLVGVQHSSAKGAEPRLFQVRFGKEVFSESYTGRVYVFLSRGSKEPRRGPDWFTPEPFLSLDVENWQPGASLDLSTSDPAVRKFPKGFDQLDLTGMVAQAVVRFNPHDRHVGTGTGNGYSKPVRLGPNLTVSLPVVQVVPERKARESQRTKVVTIQSKLLSEFHHRPVELRAAITLPLGYQANSNHRYPVIYEIPGFGGTHLDARQWQRHQRQRMNTKGVDFIKVLLDPSCPLGHHVFANSANNGPYLDALVQEFIPEIDHLFRTDAREYGRFLTGHSSGGWSSLWIQVNSPKTFGGTWSTSPDPVDLRDFQRINVYEPGEKMFVDNQGQRRPLARMNGRIMLWYDDFSHMEDVLGFGGQLHSFEAVFSPRGVDGLPVLLWNRKTGEINPDVAESWKKYDINLILQNHWQELEPDLKGKLHVFMGDLDTFYLEGATMLLRETMVKLGSDAKIVILPGKNHMNLFAGGLDRKIEEEIAAQYLEHQNSKPSE